MAQLGSIGSTSVRAPQHEGQLQQAASAPTSSGNFSSLRNIEPIIDATTPQIQSAPYQTMQTPSQSNWWGQGIGELFYTMAVFPRNFFLAAPSATNLGMRGTNYLATPSGQATASIAMSLLENSQPIVDTLLKLSQQEEGQKFLNSVKNLAASLPGIAQNLHQIFRDNPELGQNICATFNSLSRTTQNVAAHLQSTPQDLENILTIIHTLSDGINNSHLTQARVEQADDDGDIFYDTCDTHAAISSIIEQVSHISPTQVTNLIDGTLRQAPTEVARLVNIITATEGNIDQLCARVAAHVTDTSINNFSPSELNTIAQSVVTKFRAAIGDIPNDDKQHLMHALLQNNPFGHIITPLIRMAIGYPPTEPVATATDSTIANNASVPNAATYTPAPITFSQRVRRFFTPVSHAVTAFGQGCWGVIQRFVALFTPQN